MKHFEDKRVKVISKITCDKCGEEAIPNLTLEPSRLVVFSQPARSHACRGLVVSGVKPNQSYICTTLSRVCKETASIAGITKNVSMHTLRHSFVTHLPRSSCGYSRHSSIAWPCQAQYHRTVYASCNGLAQRCN